MTQIHSDGRVADADADNWVDLYCPGNLRPYMRLSRADRPAGTWLLLLPCFWSIGLATAHSGTGWTWLTVWLVAACSMGAFLMRGAGCTWNDFTDRHIDAKVSRTLSRPIPSGQVTPKQAILWMGMQALLAFLILLTFNATAILFGILSLLPVAIYPFAKRFTWWPQVFLGIAFNWGAILCWVAVTGSLALPAVFLYLGGILWTLFYDTIYAHQDREDDALIGVKSTARLFDKDTPKWLFGFLIGSTVLFSLAVILALGPTENPLSLIIGLAGVWGFGWHLTWQLRNLDIDDPDICHRLFGKNRDTGLILAVSLAIASLITA